MKKLMLASILALLVAAGTTVRAQNNNDEYLGLPGDNLNLYAVMDLFQKSQTLEDFERSLNDENSRINNLDLNGDNRVDYIMVNDYVDGNVHNIVLQVAIGPNEKQDVAVFTVQKFPNGSAQIQLIGDEALYGPNYIVEPIYAETPNPGYRGRRGNVAVVGTTYFEVADWPLITFIYRPHYIVWHSAWDWDYYPVYWHPWTPFYYHYYYGYHHNFFPEYYSHYHHYDHLRYARYNDFYYHNHRAYSNQVSYRIKEGNYRSTYSRPESRREGEALYARTHSDRVSTYSNNGRRSNSSVSRRESSNTMDRADRRGNSSSDMSVTRRGNSAERADRRNNSSSDMNVSRRSNSPVNTETRRTERVNRSSSPSRESGSSAGTRNERRSNDQSSSSRRSSTPAVQERTVTDRSSGPNMNRYERSTTTVINRSSAPVSRSYDRSSSMNVNRRSDAGNSRSYSSPSYGRSSSTSVSRSESPRMQSRPEQNSRSESPRIQSTRSTRQESAPRISSSSQRASRSSSSANNQRTERSSGSDRSDRSRR